MKVNYKGMDSDFNYRVAEISWDDENEKENKTIKDLVYLMKIHGGYDLQIIADGYASCEVDNYEEYREFVKLYKEIKHHAALWRKFGH